MGSRFTLKIVSGIALGVVTAVLLWLFLFRGYEVVTTNVLIVILYVSSFAACWWRLLRNPAVSKEIIKLLWLHTLLPVVPLAVVLFGYVRDWLGHTCSGITGEAISCVSEHLFYLILSWVGVALAGFVLMVLSWVAVVKDVRMTKAKG